VRAPAPTRKGSATTSSSRRDENDVRRKRSVEAELVAQLQLAPKLLVTLMRRHSGLARYGKMRKFHGIILLDYVWCRGGIARLKKLQRRLADETVELYGYRYRSH